MQLAKFLSYLLTFTALKAFKEYYSVIDIRKFQTLARFLFLLFKIIYICTVMKPTTEQIAKMKAGFMKAVKEKQAFVKHFANGGKVEDFKPQENRTVVRPL
ncbi:hypothetical protein FA048_11340 [Pedobacter polaris]|uniref:Uncharacterized protein n=1 Tax=Pedobacter polaris TaxID=2571273 RepID=A0A4U1CXD0_9SPHI|nr:hypothetical protein [Pedobacter polaris]TKC10758.1 hypothetical protein FA048_11340 [Pedobacter polaris]